MLDVADLGAGVRRLTVSNPARANALDDGLLDALERALRTTDPVRAWVLTSAGQGAFSSGYDLQALTAYGADQPLPDERLGDVFDLLSAHPAPSIAVVTGAAFGAGCELACACDFRVGDRRAVFCLPPAKLGIVYAPRGVRRVASRVGEQRARWLLLTARKVPAAEAASFGLLDLLVDDAQAAALALANELAGLAPLAMGGLKAVLAGGPSDRVDRLRREAFNSADAAEGRAAFLARRPAVFTGH